MTQPQPRVEVRKDNRCHDAGGLDTTEKKNALIVHFMSIRDMDVDDMIVDETIWRLSCDSAINATKARAMRFRFWPMLTTYGDITALMTTAVTRTAAFLSARSTSSNFTQLALSYRTLQGHCIRVE